jgi:putative hemolysin
MNVRSDPPPAGGDPAGSLAGTSPEGLTRPLRVRGHERTERDFECVSGDYAVRLARNEQELRAAQRVRFEVFHLELGEGDKRAAELGIDVDPFDPFCDHLLLIERDTQDVVGTYRLQTLENAKRGFGLYCGQQFAMEVLPERYLRHAVELGRACIHAEHRHGNALFALWQGIASYLTCTGKRFLFGCCSLTGVDERVGRIAEEWLARNGKSHPDLRIPVRPAHACARVDVSDAEVSAFRLPKLFGTYLRYGALNCSEPSLDHSFGTTDFLVLLDVEAMDPRLAALFFDT